MKARILEIKPSELELGGIPVFLLNVLPRLSAYAFTCMFVGAEHDDKLVEKFTEKDINVACYTSHGWGGGFGTLCEALSDELSRNSYDILHIHASNVRNTAALCKAAKRCGVKRIVVHSHNVTPVPTSIKKIVFPTLRRRITGIADVLLACSSEAGCSLFGRREWERRGVFIPNGIDLEKYTFSQENRKAIRGDDLKSYIVGQVGRLAEQKNYHFTLEVFACLKKAIPEAKLWIIGEGDLRDELIGFAESLELTDCVRFFGGVADPAPYYCGMDAFLMPSLYEGLGIALLEAQASGLPCLVSEHIPLEAKIAGCDVHVMSLSDGPLAWAKELERMAQLDCRRELQPSLSCFSIDAAARQMDEVYASLLQKDV